MSDDLGRLLDDFKKQREAELTAITAQTNALQSTLKDTRNQLNSAQAKLIAARSEHEDAQRAAAVLITTAERRAAAIIGEADKVSQEANAVLAAAQAQAGQIVQQAHLDAGKVQDQITAKKRELQGVINQIGAAQTQLGALKQQARDFADK